MTGASDDAGEYSTGSIVSGETGFAHAGAIVYYQSGNIVVTHVGFVSLAKYATVVRKVLVCTLCSLSQTATEHRAPSLFIPPRMSTGGERLVARRYMPIYGKICLYMVTASACSLSAPFIVGIIMNRSEILSQVYCKGSKVQNDKFIRSC